MGNTTGVFGLETSFHLFLVWVYYCQGKRWKAETWPSIILKMPVQVELQYSRLPPITTTCERGWQRKAAFSGLGPLIESPVHVSATASGSTVNLETHMCMQSRSTQTDETVSYTEETRRRQYILQKNDQVQTVECECPESGCKEDNMDVYDRLRVAQQVTEDPNSTPE